MQLLAREEMTRRAQPDFFMMGSGMREDTMKISKRIATILANMLSGGYVLVVTSIVGNILNPENSFYSFEVAPKDEAHETAKRAMSIAEKIRDILMHEPTATQIEQAEAERLGWRELALEILKEPPKVITIGTFETAKGKFSVGQIIDGLPEGVVFNSFEIIATPC